MAVNPLTGGIDNGQGSLLSFTNPNDFSSGVTGKLADSFKMALQGAQYQTGKKPVIPTLDRVTQDDVSQFNQFNFQELGNMVRDANPYFDSQAAAVNDNIMADLSGVLPQDVVDRYRNLAAASTVGSGASQRDTTTLRDLGILSLDRTDKGFAKSLQFGNYMKDQLVPEQQLLTPGFEAQQNESQFNRNLLQANVDAAADPGQAALGKVLETYAGLLASKEFSTAPITQSFGSPVVSGTGSSAGGLRGLGGETYGSGKTRMSFNG
jgi:hypothetical protein